jgi:hypothetical protein
MSSFYAHFYAGMQWTALPLLALLLFLGTFVAVIVRVSLASRRQEIEVAALLPFDAHETVTSEASERDKLDNLDKLERRARS